MVKIVSFEAESNKGGLSKVREGWVGLESSFFGVLDSGLKSASLSK